MVCSPKQKGVFVTILVGFVSELSEGSEAAQGEGVEFAGRLGHRD